MKTWTIRLTPFHGFNRFPASDTLFGAICWGIKRIHGETELLEILKTFNERPLFVLSSSLPYLVFNSFELPFYPRPLVPSLFQSDINSMAHNKKEKVELINKYKKFKKVEYISGKILNKVLDGVSEKELFEDFIEDKIIKRGNLLIESEYKDSLPETLFKNILVQKNSIDRLSMSTTGEGQTFYEEEYFPSAVFNLHFLIKTDTIDFFLPIFRYLEDKGIGGNRSTGKGIFKINVAGEFHVNNIDSKQFMTLSRCIPYPEEIDLEKGPLFYEILPYRGKVDSEAEFKGEDIWKSKIIYLKEGSIFQAKEKKEFYGTMPVVKKIEDKNIYQYGVTFPMFGKFGG